MKGTWKWTLSIAVFLVALAGSVYLSLRNNSSISLPDRTTQAPKLCEGVKVVFFPGGSFDDSFAQIVYKGARDAEAALGANVEYVWSGWDTNLMVSQFKDAIAEAPDAIAMMGHPGADALGFLVDEAERKHIIVTLQNVDIPSVREKYSSNGFGYVGQILSDSGAAVGNGILRKYMPEKGTEAIVFGVDKDTDPSRYERTKGVIDSLKAGGLVVHEITMPLEVNKDAKSPATKTMFSDALAKYPNSKIIVTDHGAVTAAAPAVLRDLGKKPGDVILAGFDLSPDTVTGIKDGYIGLVLDQQPYLQGFLPVLQSCLTKKYGFAGLFVNTGVGLIDDSNVGLVESLSKEQIR